MSFRFKYHFKNILLLLVFIILNACKFQEPLQNHGILFLENRSEKLVLKVSNKNDVIKIIGYPHSKAIDNNNEWLYFERTLTKGEYHKLGRTVLKTNNVLVLNFDKFGILQKKKFLNKESKKKIAFSEQATTNQLTKKSFVENFLSSIRKKMYGNK
jgi:outer membrane protein assembly factor BamE (lipoprotein component of BamABCDE complex)